MRLVIAIGGNSLIKNKKENSISDQFSQIESTANSLKAVIQNGNEVVITHGNGPQVGFLLQMQENTTANVPEMPIDYCVSCTQGGIGYQIQNAFQNLLYEIHSDKNVVSVVTRCIVDKNDPAFQVPTKPIGSFFSYEEIATKAAQHGWQFIEDAGRGYRRVVASPKPKLIIEKDLIRQLISHNALVVAAGGGGIPVILEDNKLQGIEAVIDKDFASALLGQEIEADCLVISTGVPHVSLHFGKANEEKLGTVSLKQMKKYLQEGHFGKGSMEPKIRAGIQFTEATKNPTIITGPEYIHDAIEGKTGTRIVFEP